MITRIMKAEELDNNVLDKIKNSLNKNDGFIFVKISNNKEKNSKIFTYQTDVQDYETTMLFLYELLKQTKLSLDLNSN